MSLLLGAAACSGGDGDGARSDQGPDDDACSVFTKAEIAAHLNVPDTAAEKAESGAAVPDPIAPQPTGVKYCTYFRSRAKNAVSGDQVAIPDVYIGLVTAAPAFSKAVFEDWTKEANAKPVRGLGARAALGGEHADLGTGDGPVLAVLHRDKVLFVAIAGGATDPRTRLQRQRLLATLALRRELAPVRASSLPVAGANGE